MTLRKEMPSHSHLDHYNGLHLKISCTILCKNIGGSERGPGICAPHPLGPIYFIFMQFLGKIWLCCGLVPLFLGNPGSATEKVQHFYKNCMFSI